MTLILTAGIFLIMLTVMTLQGFLMYLYWRIFYQANIPIPQFWRPIPLLAVLSAVVWAGLTLLLSRIPLKPIRDLIEAINQLADGNFKVRIHLDLNREFERLSESFNRMAQELENTELLRSDFINNFSHEFKTPIVSLRGFAKILKSDTLTREERDEYLVIIISESNRLAQLATNVLNLSKVENTSILTDVSAFELSEEIRQAILLLETKWQKKELEWILELDELIYSGNKDLLNQMWINLIDNAIKFSHHDSTIYIQANSRYEKIFISVKDTGIGIPKDSLKKIWERFYKTDLSRGKDKRGTGLGLSIVKEIIQAHGENIDVVSTEGVGTEFIFSLPRSTNL